MNKTIMVLMLLCLHGCASNNLETLSVEQQLQLTRLIDNVSARQQVDQRSSPSPSVFVAAFDLSTKSLLAEPQLMPALLQLTQRHVTLLIEIKPDAAQLQLLTHGITLSASLQDFLVAQQFVVERRLAPNAASNQIRIELATVRGH